MKLILGRFDPQQIYDVLISELSSYHLTFASSSLAIAIHELRYITESVKGRLGVRQSTFEEVFETRGVAGGLYS